MNEGVHSRSDIAEWLEQIDGVLAAAITLDFSGAAQQVWVALANGASPAVVRETVADRLSALGIHCPANAVRIGVVPEPARTPAPAPGRTDGGARVQTPATPRREEPYRDVARDNGESPTGGEPPEQPRPRPPATGPRRRERPRRRPDASRPADARKPTDRFLLLADVETRSSANRMRIRVTLTQAGQSFRGVAIDVDTETGRARAAARATLDAAMNAVPGPRLALDALQIQPLFGRRFVALSVEAAEGRRVSQLSAMNEIEGSLEHAAATAALRAVERWISM